ncbi:MAG: hypothetical protein CO108_16195 [Deltaproteobacteria bacterium CG_4_9_14_3_um_filter_63_12]|nr:MAG: hypothetical protein COW42_00210 [Deltaproteobacteria bacterium CG17_big_fil_post_rev_8_21_14_2_50_63_7]PJB39882.1 MAG: hypothetical protein CO108_16195 [Deltaproteobacteria bacterium CG_4_9_14_3_um_filter_63_12]
MFKLILTIAVVSLGLSPTSAAHADPYLDGTAQLAALIEGGELVGAQQKVIELRALYSQDYALALQHGWLATQLGATEEAAAAYQRAAELSGGADEADLGLALSWIELGDERAASAVADIDDPKVRAEARAALDAAEAATAFEFGASGALFSTTYTRQTARDSALGVQASADFAWGPALLDFDVRALSYGYKGDPGRRNQAGASFSQTELYGGLGYAALDWGVQAQYGTVFDASSGSDVQIVGGSLRWSPYGDLVLEESSSFYAAENVHRLALSWRVPFGDWFTTFGGATQFVGSDTYSNGFLTAGWAADDSALWVGGKLGDEYKPVYLAFPAIFNGDELLEFGASAGGSLALSERWWLAASYSWDRLELDGASADAHTVSVSLGAHTWE